MIGVDDDWPTTPPARAIRPVRRVHRDCSQPVGVPFVTISRPSTGGVDQEQACADLSSCGRPLEGSDLACFLEFADGPSSCQISIPEPVIVRGQGDDRWHQDDVRISVQPPLRLLEGDVGGDDRLDDGAAQISIDLCSETCSRRFENHATFWICLRGGRCRSTRTATPAIGGLNQ